MYAISITKSGKGEVVMGEFGGDPLDLLWKMVESHLTRMWETLEKLSERDERLHQEVVQCKADLMRELQSYKESQKKDEQEYKKEKLESRTAIIVAVISLMGVVAVAVISLLK